MPVELPSERPNSRGLVQLDVQISPSVVTIFPPVEPEVYGGIPGAPVTGALGLDPPFAQTQCTERHNVVPLAEFGRIHLYWKRYFSRSLLLVGLSDRLFQI